MGSIISLVDGKPLALLYRATDVADERSDETPPENILQVCAKLLPPGRTFKPHMHLPLERRTVGTQEAWVIIRGGAYAAIYDVDDSFVTRVFLHPGDCLVMLRGGHAMETALTTLLYEFKNGPYEGQESDKRWLA